MWWSSLQRACHCGSRAKRGGEAVLGFDIGRQADAEEIGRIVEAADIEAGLGEAVPELRGSFGADETEKVRPA